MACSTSTACIFNNKFCSNTIFVYNNRAGSTDTKSYIGSVCNRYGDIDYMCAINGYFMHSINKDISKIKHFTPGGRELECRYERKKTI